MGSTGSIGTQALDIIEFNPELRVVGLGAGKNIHLLEEQARKFSPKLVCVSEEADAKELRIRLSDLNIRVASGMDGLIELASMEESDLFLTAIVGMIGIRPTLAAIESGKTIALANKETLVTAGHLIIPLAQEKNVKILPVDSEHSAIYQCLAGTKEGKDGRKPLRKIWLTASGGPFYGKKVSELEQITLKQALDHPNWSMGTKVTIDSATLVNKGLEVMEASWLFDTPVDDIIPVIQRDSIIHSMVEFTDGSVIAQLGVPDMHVPIAYALNGGDRSAWQFESPDFFKLGSLSFAKPDTETFKGLPLALCAAHTGGSMPTVFNAANEAAVKLFTGGTIRFLQIYDVIEAAMQAHTPLANPSLDDILETEKETHLMIHKMFENK